MCEIDDKLFVDKMDGGGGNMLDLYVTRHGQTVWNIERRFQGRKDSPLTELGRIQAALLHERIKNLELDVIYTSPSKRTIETTRLIKGNLDIPVHEAEELYEMDFGEWEGQSIDEVLKEHSQLYEHLVYEPDKYVPVTGESFDELFMRTRKIVEEIKRKYWEKKVLIVTHGVTRKALMAQFHKSEVDEFWKSESIAKQTSLTHIRIEDNGESRILLNNDYTHWKHLEKEITI